MTKAEFINKVIEMLPNVKWDGDMADIEKMAVKEGFLTESDIAGGLGVINVENFWSEIRDIYSPSRDTIRAKEIAETNPQVKRIIAEALEEYADNIRETRNKAKSMNRQQLYYLPRYRYIKNIKVDGEDFEIEIDELRGECTLLYV